MNTRTKGRRAALGKYGMLVAGTAILAFGLYNIHRQSNITEGGVLGLVLFFDHWLGITPALISPVLDISCYLIGFRFLGREFAKCSVIASLSFACWYALFEKFPPLLPSLAEHPAAAALLGGCFVGLGVGLAVRAGGAAGGDDALAMTISHVTKWPISRAYLFTDLVVLALSTTYISPKNLLCSLITVTVSSFLIGRVQTFRKKEPSGGVPLAVK
ncbi:MAG: YitT family protein [Angelakisella sp.]|jgi:uncharacterized membrane-anchored protein YitT (DUF2179 family)|nr:YitT family protein [Angelakisella sp.]